MSRSPWRVREVDAVDDGEWGQLLALDPRSLLFHNPRWLRRYIQHHPLKQARWLEARDSDGRLVAGLPFALSRRLGLRALASGVAGTYGGPVRVPGMEAAEAELMRRYLRIGGWRSILREMLWAHSEPPAGECEDLLPAEAAVIDLEPGYDEIWKSVFSNNRRNECNRSEKRGLSTEYGREPRWLDEFLPLYRERCAQWRTRPLSGDFLHAVLEEEEGAAWLCRAVYQDRQVGLHFCLDLSSQLLAWVGSSQRVREVFPATMLVRQDLLLALDRSSPLLNLGSSLGLDGVARFKGLMGAGDRRTWLIRREASWLRRLRRS